MGQNIKSLAACLLCAQVYGAEYLQIEGHVSSPVGAGAPKSNLVHYSFKRRSGGNNFDVPENQLAKFSGLAYLASELPHPRPENLIGSVQIGIPGGATGP